MESLVLPLLILTFLIPSRAVAQVRINVPAQRYKAQEEIHAKVENTGNRPVTFCVDVGQISGMGDEIKATPSPFWVQ
jgi:hypothetical protein